MTVSLFRPRSGPCQFLLLTSFGLPGIDLGSPVPQAKEAETVPLGPRDGKGDLGQASERLTVPCKTVRHDHDPVGLSVQLLMLLAAPNEPALRGQLHRDRRQATCVEDAIVGPKLNSGEG